MLSRQSALQCACELVGKPVLTNLVQLAVEFWPRFGEHTSLAQFCPASMSQARQLQFVGSVLVTGFAQLDREAPRLLGPLAGLCH